MTAVDETELKPEQWNNVLKQTIPREKRKENNVKALIELVEKQRKIMLKP